MLRIVAVIYTLIASVLLASSAVAEPITTSALPTAVADLIKRYRFNAGDLSFYVQAVDHEQAVIAHEAQQLQVLASTAKIPTTIAALHNLGHTFRWRTNVFLRGKLTDGVLDGDVLIVGGGDPGLDGQDLTAIMGKLAKRGLKQIKGNIFINRAAFSLNEKDHALTPIPQADRVHHVRPDALIINQNMITIEFEPDAAKGFKVAIQPELHGIELVNKLSATGGPCLRSKSSLEFALNDVPADASGASRRQLVLSGTYPADCGARRWEIAPLPANEQARLAIHHAWLKTGGSLEGEVLDATPPLAATAKTRVRAKARTKYRAPKPFLTHESAPLGDIIDEVNKWSNNVLARHLFLALSPEFPRKPATLAAARERMQLWLEAQGISKTVMQLDNGSGLSREEKGSAQALGQLLVAAWRNEEIRKRFLPSLPLVGVDGTMGNRLKQSSAAGKAHIKTGTLTGVRAVAGYVRGASGKMYAFVAIANSANTSGAQAVHDLMIEWVHQNG
jgi:serine-type D-Ala-D-Ala carboxypeptidase/endopeptidase (penicillin-binding protein 4)